MLDTEQTERRTQVYAGIQRVLVERPALLSGRKQNVEVLDQDEIVAEKSMTGVPESGFGIDSQQIRHAYYIAW